MGQASERMVRAAVLAIATVVAACSSNAGELTTSVDTSDSTTTGTLAFALAQAAQHSGVPRDLLVAIARVEDGLELPAQRLDLEEDSAVPAAGPLMLRHGKLDTLARAAALSGKSELELRQDSDLALDAGALVLAELGAKTGARADNMASWKSAIEEMSGYADEDHREEYAHRVFATLARGGTLDARGGQKISLPKYDLPPTLTLDIETKLHTLAISQFPGAQWIPTSCNGKCTSGRGGAKVQYIVIHDTEGGWDASVATLQNDPGKSVQYIVGTDGKVAQFVTEETTAWHAGNRHFNQRSIGIEHVGYSTKPYTEANYAASAKLVDYLAKKFAVPRDRAHIIGHDQIPNGNRISQSAAPCGDSPKACGKNLDYGGAGHHTDPGVWEWPTFMARLGAASKCNDVTSQWTCSNDKGKAFRCAANKVAVEMCDGAGACEDKPSGQDDLCHAAVKPASAPPISTTDPGTAAPSPPPPSETTGAAVTLPEGDLEAPPSDDAGACAVGNHPGRDTSGVGLGLVLVAAALVIARTRAHTRPTSRSRTTL